MKIKRVFEKVARKDGVLRYTRIQKLPMRVKVNGFNFQLKDDTAQARQHILTIFSGDQQLIHHTFDGMQPPRFLFPEPWKLVSGNYEFKTQCTGFEAGEKVSFDVEVDFNLWIL